METVKNKTFNIPSVEELGFDPVVLRKKYAEEREKRLRKDGNAQYQEVTGDFDQYNLDPYVCEKIVREPVTEIIDAAIIGGGFGGLLAAVRLLEAGIKNIRIIETAGDFGGTWYWTRDPGAQCDIESYIYLPLLEEVNYILKKNIPSEMRYLNTLNVLDVIMIYTRGLFFKPRLEVQTGMRKTEDGELRLIGVMSSMRNFLLCLAVH